MDEETEDLYHERFSRRMNEWLDQGSGSCLLKTQLFAMIVASALLYFDDQRYLLRNFVVMPNHVHVLFLPLGDHTIAEIMQSWKGFTARSINRHLGASGALWQQDYWDRLIRNEKHFERTNTYIQENPLKARLRKGEFILGIRDQLIDGV